MMQESLSKLDSIVLCDAHSEGFPMRYASDGFQKLFGYNPKECSGQRYGALTGCAAVAADAAAVADISKASGLDVGDVQSRITFLLGKENQCMESGQEAGGFAVLLNIRKDGSIFTCEFSARVCKHPARGWSYCVGYQKDITDEVDVGELLQAASEERYGSLMEGREAARSRTVAKMTSQGSAKFLNSKAEEMWMSFMTAHQPTKTKEAKKSGDQRSMMSRSTTASGVSAVSAASGKSSSAWPAIPSAGGSSTGVAAQPVHPLLMLWGAAPQEPAAAAPAESGGFQHARSKGGSRARFLDLLEEVDDGLPPSPLESPRVTEEEEDAISVAAEGQKGILSPRAGEHGLSLSEGNPGDAMDVATACDGGKQAMRSSMEMHAAPQPASPASEQSPELIQVVGDLDCRELHDLDFSLLIMDPSRPGCPLVSCSAGFEDLMQLEQADVNGQPLDLLLKGVPGNMVDVQSQAALTHFLDCARKGEYLPAHKVIPEDLPCEYNLSLVEGELVCVQTYCRKSGKLVRLMHYMKLVELEDFPFVVSLQTKIPDALIDTDSETSWCTVDSDLRFWRAYARLSENMEVTEQVLGSQFWYSAPMRRQVACEADPFDGNSDVS